MPNIDYTATCFPRSLGSMLHGTHTIEVSWNDIVWAAISVGKTSLTDMFAHSHHSVDEILYRAYMIWANLWEADGRIYRSPAYDKLDPTEKGAISYFLGMTVAKLFSWRLFSAPWMVHLDRLVDYHDVGLLGRSRPDLAGLDVSRRWLVVEGKGRSGNYSQATMDQAKKQVRQIRDIAGKVPHLKVGVQSYFSPCLFVTLVDPEEPLADSISIELSEDDVVSAYYGRFDRLRESPQRTRDIAGSAHNLVDFDAIGVSVGIANDAEARLSRKQEEQNVSAWQDTPSAEQPWKYTAYEDGIAIGLDSRWSSAAMRKTPRDR